MSIQNILNGDIQGYADVVSVVQASVNGLTVVAGSALNAGPFTSVSFTIVIATHDVDWQVFGANVSDFSDEVSVQTLATVATGAAGSFAESLAPFRYYRVKIKSTASGQVGSATVNGVAKN